MSVHDDSRTMNDDSKTDLLAQETDSVPSKASSPSSPSKGEVAVDDVVRKDDQRVYLQGLRLWAICIGVGIALFLVNLEIPIVTTSLVGITNDLKGYNRVSWIISSYLLGFVGVLIIFAKLSDIFGRKLFVLLSISIFIIFSAACGGAQTMTQLIVFRAFQGVGGGGCFALGTAMITELVPPDKYATYTANLSLVYSLSLLLGPIIGGAICDNTTWRWIFLLNVPCGALALAISAVAIPNNFPNHGQPNYKSRSLKMLLSKTTLRRVDLPGSLMLLIATLALTAAFEEADSQFSWSSAFVITLLAVSAVLWIMFLIWERRVTFKARIREPVFPWRFIQNRQMIALILDALFLGGPWFVAIFQYPQKYQIVYGTSPLQAGIRLMPFTFAAPVGSVLTAIIMKKFKVPPIYIVLLAASLQVVGFALLATLPDSPEFQVRQYGYQIIAGFGCGTNSSTLLLMVPFCVEDKDKAVGMGTVSQFRVMGGAIVLAIATSVFNGYTKSRISDIVPSEQASALFQSSVALDQLAGPAQYKIKSIFAHGFNLQMIVLCAFAAAQIPTSLLMWKRKQITV